MAKYDHDKKVDARWGDVVRFRDANHAIRYLRRHVSNGLELHKLRRVIRDHQLVPPGWALSSGETLRAVAQLLASGRIALGRSSRFPRFPYDTSRIDGEGLAAPVTQDLQPSAEHSITLRVIEDLGDRELPGVELILTKPDGSIQELKTDDAGEIRVGKLASGRYGLSSPWRGKNIDQVLAFVKRGPLPSRRIDREQNDVEDEAQGRIAIVLISVYHVKTGDTLQSLAKVAGMSKMELAEFNWGTSDPEEINDRLGMLVGCTRVDPETGDYVLDSSDYPGIIYLPQDWSVENLELDHVHYLRVKCLPEPLEFLFSF